MSDVHTLEVLAQVTGVSTETLADYQQHGLIHEAFDDETVRQVRRLDHLRECCEMNLDGVRLMAHLLDEVERLRTELRRQLH